MMEESARRDRPPLTLQQLVAAAERLERDRSAKLGRLDWLGLVEEARDRLAQPALRLDPLPCFEHSHNGKKRWLVDPGPLMRLVAEALRPRIDSLVETLAPDPVHGYRRGRSTLTAAGALARLLSDGKTHLVFADIRDFFSSIDRRVLADVLRRDLPASTVELLLALASSPLRKGTAIEQTVAGIPLGIAVSPALSNLYLADADAAMMRQDVGWVRYADDIVIAAGSRADAAVALETLRTALAELRLELNPDKVLQQECDGETVEYLGHVLSAEGVFARVGDGKLHPREPGSLDGSESQLDGEPPSPVNRRVQTLYVTEPGLYLRTERGQVQVKRRDEIVREIPFHRLDRVVVMAGSSFSSGFVASCLAHRIPVLYMLGKGHTFGSLIAGGMPNPLRLRAQYDLHASAERRLGLARNVLDAKFAAMLQKVAMRGSPADVTRIVAQAREALDSAQDVATMLGLEGNATRAYYRAFASWIRADGFEMTKRSHRPPRDPINSLLSFSYSLIFGEVQSSLLVHGLDPYPGVLHELHRNHPALASDLVEPYRVLVAEPFVLMLVNRGDVRPDGFETRSRGGVYMNGDTRRHVLDQWERYSRAAPSGGSQASTPRGLLDAAVLAMVGLVLGEQDELRLPIEYGDLKDTEVILADLADRDGV